MSATVFDEVAARILPVAELVRAEAEAWAKEKGYDHETLVTLCAPTSFAFTALARAGGLEAEVVAGEHALCGGHMWALVAERQGRHPQRWRSTSAHAIRWAMEVACTVDLTATQFEVDPRPARIVVVPPGGMGPAGYLVGDFGDDLCRRFLWDRDKADVEALTARVMAAAVRVGMVAPALALEELAGVEPGLTVSG